MKLSGGSWPNSAVHSIVPTGMMPMIILMTITFRTLILVVIVLIMTLALGGCAQHESSVSEEAPSVDQHLPFDGRSAKAGIFPTGSLTPTAIPAGTPLAVHLRVSLSSATSRPGDSFDAILDEPIYIRGRMVAPRGAIVTGRVLDARAAGELQEPGYLRLALIAVSLNGQSLPVQTSSIFVKRGSHRRRNAKELIGSSMSESPAGSAPTSNATISNVSISKASISRPSISKISTGSLAGNGSGTANRASAGKADAALETDYVIENNDVGVAPARRLTFRLAQPVPLEM
jgi:hypothetical protein